MRTILAFLFLAMFSIVAQAQQVGGSQGGFNTVPKHGRIFSGRGSGAVWGIFACASSIILAAMQKNALGKGELTPPEAWTCGLLEYYNAATGRLVYVPHKTICTMPERCS